MNGRDVVFASFDAVNFHTPTLFWTPRSMCPIDVKQPDVFKISPKQETILPHTDANIQYGRRL